MKMYKEKGRVFEFQKRSKHNETEFSDFMNFKKRENPIQIS